MWVKIERQEYFKLLEHYNNVYKLVEHNLTEWLDFMEIEWRTYDGVNLLRKTEQESYDEVESYPLRATYFKWSV
jgi:hypothetical protein